MYKIHKLESPITSNNSYYNWIIKTWLKNNQARFFEDFPEYNHYNPTTKTQSGHRDPDNLKRYYQIYHPVITGLLKTATDIYVATYNPPDEDIFIGFLVGHKGEVTSVSVLNPPTSLPCVDYVYVKDVNRQLGVANALFTAFVGSKDADFVYSHIPKDDTMKTYLSLIKDMSQCKGKVKPKDLKRLYEI